MTIEEQIKCVLQDVDAFNGNCFSIFGVEALRPSQQFFSHVGTETLLPWYYQYF